MKRKKFTMLLPEGKRNIIFSFTDTKESVIKVDVEICKKLWEKYKTKDQ